MRRKKEGSLVNWDKNCQHIPGGIRGRGFVVDLCMACAHVYGEVQQDMRQGLLLMLLRCFFNVTK